MKRKAAFVGAHHVPHKHYAQTSSPLWHLNLMTIRMVDPTLQMKKLGLRRLRKFLAQGHTAEGCRTRAGPPIQHLQSLGFSVGA